MTGTALVTGGARRIGAAIARSLAKAGFAVAIHGRTVRPEASALQSEIVRAGGRAVVLEADLAVSDEVRMLVKAAARALGPLSLLVNNASEFEADAMGGLDEGQFDRHLAVNLRAPIFLAQAFAAQAPAGGGSAVVNITDQRVLKPTPLCFSYALSKCGLHAATIMMAQALAPNVRVNAIAPGPVLPSRRQSAEDFARQSAAVPLGHGVDPEEIAAAVLFLARARSITGQTITVDGGQHLAWKTEDVWGITE